MIIKNLVNILITNHCNQNCSFCFTKVEMSNKSLPNEINIQDFKTVLKKMRQSKDEVRLLGGEPTLHSQFEKIIKTSLKSFPCVHIFSNGVFNNKIIDILKPFFPRIRITFNVMIPYFMNNKITMSKIIENILYFAPRTQTKLSITLMPSHNINLIVKKITKPVIRAVYAIRIGCANPLANSQNAYNFSDFPLMGDKIQKLVAEIRNINPKVRLHFNCGLTRCMFTNKQFFYLKKHSVESIEWGCFGKISCMDISTNLSAFQCSPLASNNRDSIKNKSLNKLDAELMLKRYDLLQKYLDNKCKKCKYFDLQTNKCPGPCIAFRLNQLTKQKNFII